MFRPKPTLRHAATVAASVAVLAVAASSAGLTEQDRAGAAPGPPTHRSNALPGALAQIVAATPTPAQTAPVVLSGPAASPARVARPVAASTLAANGVPTTALRAYQRAAKAANERTGGCHIAWPLVAAIGRVESDHGRFHGAVLHADGVSTPGIVGVPLDGTGTEVIHDTDKGALDGDRTYDRAVGPMQFIPSTWARWRTDGDHDGTANPNDIDDAAAATAAYLCAAGGDLRTYAGQRRAVLAYNHSTPYFTSVFALEKIYARGVTTVPTAPGHGDARLPRPAHRSTPAPSTTTRPAPTQTTPPRSSAKPTTSTPSSPRPGTPKPTTSPTCPTTSPTASPSASPSPTVSSCPSPSGTTSAAASATAASSD